MKKREQKRLSTLTDFDIHEVSLVDLAANKRRFLIAKRSNNVPADDAANPPANEDTNQDTTTTSTDGTTSEAARHDVADIGKELLAGLAEVQQAIAHLQKAPRPQSDEPQNVDESEQTRLTKSLQQRLTRLEKQIGLPNSNTVEPLRTPTAHIWPFDLNDRGAGSHGDEG